MSDSQTNSTPDAPQSSVSDMLGDFKKLLPTLLISVLAAGATSWYNTQKSQTDLQNRIEKTEEKVETNARNIAQNSGVLQQNAIRIAEIGIIQNNALEQIKDLKQEQNEIKTLLNRK